MQFSVIENLCFTCSGTGSCGCVTQSDTIRDCYFYGCDFGILIGQSGFQASETTIINCFFNSCTTAGVSTANFNALSNCVYGGNFQHCATGIWVQKGSCPVISGCGFQRSTNFDIEIDSSSNDTYNIAGVRTESANFLLAKRGSCVLTGVEHNSPSANIFVQNGFHPITMINCISATPGGFINGNQAVSTHNALWACINCEFALPLSSMVGYGSIINSWFNGTIDHVRYSRNTFYQNASYQNGTIYEATNVGVGYQTGAGGTVSQSGSKSTGVTLNRPSGQITMNATSLGANAIVSFTLTNSFIAATDILVLNHISGGTVGSYLLNAQAGSGSATITVTNITSGALAEAIVIAFSVFKSVNS